MLTVYSLEEQQQDEMKGSIRHLMNNQDAQSLHHHLQRNKTHALWILSQKLLGPRHGLSGLYRVNAPWIKPGIVNQG